MNTGKLAKMGTPRRTDRGKFRLHKSPNGQADYAEVCIREADGTFVWRRLVTQANVQVEAVETPVQATTPPAEAKVTAPAPQVEMPSPQAEVAAPQVETPAP